MTRNKNIGIAIIAALLLLATGTAAYFVFVRNDNNVDTTANNQDNVPSAPEVPSGPGKLENQSTPENLESVDEPDSTPPAGALSPHKVATNLNSYFDQELRLYGLIIETSTGNYSIRSQDPNENQGIRMIAGDNIDMTTHISSVKTATGRLIVLEDGTVAFSVSSIE